MAQLFYRYGTMNSGKTIEIIKVAHNYEEQHKSVIIMTSALDTREKEGMIESRIGWSERPSQLKTTPTFSNGCRKLMLTPVAY